MEYIEKEVNNDITKFKYELNDTSDFFDLIVLISKIKDFTIDDIKMFNDTKHQLTLKTVSFDAEGLKNICKANDFDNIDIFSKYKKRPVFFSYRLSDNFFYIELQNKNKANLESIEKVLNK